MEPRRTVEDTLEFAIKHNEGYKCDITWGDFLECKVLLKTDRVLNFTWREETSAVPFSCDDTERTYYTFYIIVARKRPETDDEYFKRVKIEEDRKKEFEERERLEYLRLKAKFEQ